MHKEQETWTVKRHISPEPFRADFEKLTLMQENLSVAAETINALKLERDKLKFSLKTALDKSRDQTFELERSRASEKSFQRDDHKRQILFEEIQNLKKFASEKDKLIENLEQKISESKLEKSEWRNLNERFDRLKLELIEKEKYIQSLEKRLREPKGEMNELNALNQNYLEVKRMLNEKISVIDLQEVRLKELMIEKSHWNKLYDLLSGIVPEYLDNERSQDLSMKSDWQRFTEVILKLKSLVTEKDRAIESLIKKSKDDLKKTERNDWDALKETNFKLKQELELANSRSEGQSFVSDIRDLVSILIEKVHSNSQLHQAFKHRFVCSKRLKVLIDNKEYPETVIRLLKFSLDLLDDIKSKLSYAGIESPTASFNRISKPITDSSYSRSLYDSKAKSKLESESLSDRYKSPIRSESNKLSCWTQTPNEKHSPQLYLSDLSDKSSKGCQASLYPKEITANKFANGSASSERIVQPPPMTKTVKYQYDSQRSPEASLPTKSRVMTSPSKNPSDFKLKDISSSIPGRTQQREPKITAHMILGDEGQQLLNIIDSQNSRLAKINNQISQLVPGSIDSIVEESSGSSAGYYQRPAEMKSGGASTGRVEFQRSLPKDDQLIYIDNEMEVKRPQVLKSPIRSDNSSPINASQKFVSLPEEKKKVNVKTTVVKPRQKTPTSATKVPQGSNKRAQSPEAPRYSKNLKPYVLEKPPEIDDSKFSVNQSKTNPNFHEDPRRPGERTFIEHESSHVVKADDDNYENHHSPRTQSPGPSDSEFYVEVSYPKNERKRSGWDFSALRIPPKEPIESKPQPKRHLSPRSDLRDGEGKARGNFSPDPNADRFGEYARPIMRKENCWESVADFFTAHGSNDKGKD